MILAPLSDAAPDRIESTNSWTVTRPRSAGRGGSVSPGRTSCPPAGPPPRSWPGCPGWSPAGRSRPGASPADTLLRRRRIDAGVSGAWPPQAQAGDRGAVGDELDHLDLRPGRGQGTARRRRRGGEALGLSEGEGHGEGLTPGAGDALERRSRAGRGRHRRRRPDRPGCREGRVSRHRADRHGHRRQDAPGGRRTSHRSPSHRHHRRAGYRCARVPTRRMLHEGPRAARP